MDMQKMLDMQPKAAMARMAEAFNSLAPQEASTDVQAHIQALMLCMMRDISSEDPEFTIKLEQAGESPPACPKCGAEYVRNGVRHNEKGQSRRTAARDRSATGSSSTQALRGGTIPTR